MARFPLSTDRYHETWATSKAHRRIDVAMAMATLSGYETMVQLDTLTLAEIDAALASFSPTAVQPAHVDIFGHGVMHAFGRTNLADSLRIDVLKEGGEPTPKLDEVTGTMRAVFRELMQDQFEWAVLSGDPRVRAFDSSMATQYRGAREQFRAEEERRAGLVGTHSVNPRNAATFYALQLHMREVVERADFLGVDLEDLPFETDPVGFVERIPTIHVLTELLSGQYQNPQTQWQDGDWADMRTLCQAVVYCDAVAPDKHWADAAARSTLPATYGTRVLRNPDELLSYLESLGTSGAP